MFFSIFPLLKSILYPIKSCYYYILCKIVKGSSVNLDVNQAFSIIKKTGYNFLDIYPSVFESLSESSKDLSIVIPVYNSERYLSQCLESILNQKTKYDYEVICVNDGSTDNSLEILNRYLEKSCGKLIVINQDNKGISGARNAGIEKSHGKYIGFMDNDDMVEDNYIETLLETAFMHKSDIVQIGFKAIDNKSRIRYTISHTKVTTSDKSVFDKELSGYIWSGVYNRELWNDIRFPQGFWYEDMITKMLLMRKAKKISIINDVLYIKRQHDNNASNTLWKKGNIKSIDQYWLVKQCTEYGNSVLKLPLDIAFVRQLCKELTVGLYFRSQFLDSQIVEAVFVLASSFVKTLNIKDGLLDGIYKDIIKVFNDKNIEKWKLISYSMLYKTSH